MGWFDNIAPWQWHDHERLARRPDWSRMEYLHIDAVDHEIYHHADTPITEATDHDVNPAALDALLPRYVSPALEFFDVFLRESRPPDLPEGALAPGPRRLEERRRVAAAGRRRADALPRLRRHALDRGAAPRRRRSSWTHDPDDLVPSRVDNPFAFLQQYPDERAYGERADVVAFSARARWTSRSSWPARSS